MNYWIMVLPCVVYFASVGTYPSLLQAGGVLIRVATGIAYVYQASETRTTSITWTHLGTLYFSIALSLPILLTLMIVMRLIAHRRDVRKFIGALDVTSGPYTAIIRMVSESYALYAITFLLYIVPWAIGSPVMNLFFDPLRAIQVRTVFSFPICAASLGHHFSIMVTGHRSVSHHSTSCQPKGVDERKEFRGFQLRSFQGPMDEE